MARIRIKSKSHTKARYSNLAGLAAKLDAVEKTVARVTLPQFKAGDKVSVGVKIREGEKERVQAFEGVVIRKKNAGANKSFTVRKMSHGVGVERTFLETSTTIKSLDVLEVGKVRRAKLYYMRERQGRAAKIERDISSGQAAAAPAKSV
jgi:large subunit ribosomal protein L19